MDSFRRHVVGRSDQRVSHGGLWAEEPAQPEVPDLDHTLSGDEDIGGLDVWKVINIHREENFEYLVIKMQ